MILYTKGRELLVRHPMMTAGIVAGVSFVLLNLNEELFISSLPSLLLFLPCLLMMAVCMRSGMGKKCEQQAMPEQKASDFQTLDK